MTSSFTIGIAPYAETGHIHATLGIAKRLKARGHRVVYFVPADLRAAIEREGLEVAELYESVLPRGWFDAHREHLRAAKGIALQRAQLRWQGLANLALAEGREDARIRSVAPDVVLTDVDHLGMRLRLHELSTPFMTVHCTFARDPEWETPYPFFPSFAQTLPRTALGRFVLLHRLVNHRMLVVPIYSALIFGRRTGMKSAAWDRMQRKYERTYGSVMAFAADHPKLVLSSRALDLPRKKPDPPGVLYAGAHVDLSRAEAPEDFAGDDRRPLVYCSLGSQTYRLRERHVRFFRLLLDVFAKRQDLRLLLAVGSDLDPSMLGPRSSNVMVRRVVPQLSALRAASLMITHGGLNTVKECITLGVPMIVFPQDLDQPGNALRVVHHGLGLRGSARAVTREGLESMVRRVLDDSSIRANVDRMSKVFREDEAHDDVERAIEAIASERASLH